MKGGKRDRNRAWYENEVGVGFGVKIGIGIVFGSKMNMEIGIGIAMGIGVELPCMRDSVRYHVGLELGRNRIHTDPHSPNLTDPAPSLPASLRSCFFHAFTTNMSFTVTT
jgi:hypothetical protein